MGESRLSSTAEMIQGSISALEATPKKVIAPGFLKEDATQAEAGSFVEWACFGGISG